MKKSIRRNPFVVRMAGSLLSGYLRFVRRTNSITVDPPDCYEVLAAEKPVIIAMWHGQHFMMPFARPEGWAVRVMISRSADGEINAIAAEKLGVKPIRASGSQKRHQLNKRGGVKGFIESLRALRDGQIMALTADVPKGPARIAGLGIVQLAKHSGCPILTMAIASSRNIHLNTWDRASINLPFGRCVIVHGDYIRVPKDADDQALEEARLAVQNSLNNATERAYELVGHKHG